ncbi:uncharacterized protein Bfra_011115 [Botrytis fragariae]|uniref:Uncharacterized protein n=1 Tax=Botrytis fragariae TaxID=1964551 RepID=A0A8H6AL61_9HELO|nr:uncharacterized protein Bfra_011115 [Botrytis fragariae]KAF5869308.1 hypothetical protein Bfra_011115 [Botrytis fragariae]
MKLSISLILLAAITYAQNATVTSAPTETVVDLFLGAKRSGNYSFEGSIITGDATATTYEIRCKSGALNLPGFPTTTCDPKDPLSMAIDTVTASLAETCRLEHQTAAYCNYTFVETLSSTTTSTSYTTIITSANYIEYPVAITAGIENLPTATTNTATATTATAAETCKLSPEIDKRPKGN